MTQAARALPTDARGPEGVRWADGVRWAVTEAVTLASWWRKPRDGDVLGGNQRRCNDLQQAVCRGLP